ncbi:MAG: xanthine dehydrogenase family protein subunit M [Actinobacteria bacterium]|nr:xanthine dehydrogenase family protein subunit M [Actinomycetota bacterium]
MTVLPAFDRHRPASLAGATELLETYGEDAVVYAGGTELFLLFKLGFAEYPHLIDLKGIGDLFGIERRDGELRIGAAETHRSIERHPLVREQWGSLATMERGVGNLRVRTMGSIGGNLCFGDPHSDPATYLLAAGARLEARRGADERREIPLASFTTGPFENALVDGELLAGVLVPAPAPGAAIVHRKFVLTERPAITVAAHLRRDGSRLADVRLAVGSAGNRPSRVERAEVLLNGREADDLEGALAEVADLAADAADPVEDANGSVDYKRHLVGVIAGRTLREALAESRGA